jgi:hypothetical protein
MLKKLGYVAGAVIFVTLVASSIPASSAKTTLPAELDLVAVHCGAAHTQCTFNNTGSPNTSAGDVWVFRVPLLDQAGSKVGTHEASCHPLNENRAICDIVESLTDGTIAEQGIFLPNSTSDLLGTFAVTGGTGAYEGVGGYAEFRFDGTDYPNTIHLTP